MGGLLGFVGFAGFVVQSLEFRTKASGLGFRFGVLRVLLRAGLGALVLRVSLQSQVDVVRVKTD